MCPTDEHCYFDAPDLLTPMYDEVHVSVTFTWDIEKARLLAKLWESHSRTPVKLGGVAINGESCSPFVPGVYLKHGIMITSRGCSNNCSFCMVNKKLIEFEEFATGNIVQDNNILACSDKHWSKVMVALKTQRDIEFKGGMESRRITTKIVDDLRSLKIKSLWLACDSDSDLKPLKKAVDLLKAGGFKRYKIFCYVLIGKEEQRLREVYDIGCMPFAQLYKPPQGYLYTQQMRQYHRTWCRPPAYKTVIKNIKKG